MTNATPVVVPMEPGRWLANVALHEGQREATDAAKPGIVTWREKFIEGKDNIIKASGYTRLRELPPRERLARYARRPETVVESIQRWQATLPPVALGMQPLPPPPLASWERMRAVMPDLYLAQRTDFEALKARAAEGTL